MKIKIITSLCLIGIRAFAGDIGPNWESMAANYHVPEWFRDGKFGIWMHWGIPSAIDENRPNDGSHYGRRMYGTADYLGGSEGDIEMTRVLSEWHAKLAEQVTESIKKYGLAKTQK